MKNPSINNFLYKYDKRDWNSVLIKLCLIAIEYLKDENIRKNFYTFDDLEEILNVIRNNNYKKPIQIIKHKEINSPVLTEKQEKIINKMNDLKMNMNEPLPKVENNNNNYNRKNVVKFINKSSNKNYNKYSSYLKNSSNKQNLNQNNEQKKSKDKQNENFKPHEIVFSSIGNQEKFNYQTEKNFLKDSQDLINKNKYENKNMMTPQKSNIENNNINPLNNENNFKQNNSMNQKGIQITEENIKNSNIPQFNPENKLNPPIDNSKYKNENNIEQFQNNYNNYNNNYNNNYIYHCCYPNYIPDVVPINLLEDYNLKPGRIDIYPYLNYEYNNSNRFNECGERIKTYEIKPLYSLDK